jgi:ribosomal protein S18 acetylase RimI-like enzyme
LAKNESVLFFTASVSDEVAGYVLAHTYGPMLWREFGTSSIGTFISTTGIYLGARLHLTTWRTQQRPSDAAPIHQPEKLDALQIEQSQAPFAWTRPDGKTAYIEMLHVKPEFRGQQLAQQLLQRVVEDIQSRKVRRAEAHIDSGNYASVRAFVSAKWQVVKRRDGDFYAYIDRS